MNVAGTWLYRAKVSFDLCGWPLIQIRLTYINCSLLHDAAEFLNEWHAPGCDIHRPKLNSLKSININNYLIADNA